MTRIILCLDLGTQMGWAVMSGDSITSGTTSFASRRFEGGGMRFLRFQRWLDEVAVGRKIESVYFEEVHRHAGTDAAHVYGGLLATLTAWCEVHSIPYQGISVGTIKKHATGKGNAGKPEMIAAAKAKGHDPKDDNEADAIAICYCAKDGIL
jgi:Holliday junction resolvasome RuvABC endonuclease subunit